MLKLLTLILLGCLAAGTVHGQHFEAGLYGGVGYYDGDLSPNRRALYFQTLRPALGLHLRHHTGGWLTLRLHYLQTTLMADDAISDRQSWRTLSFESPYREVAVAGEVNLFRWHVFRTDLYVEPYLLAGAGVFHFNPKTRYEGRWVELQPLGTEGQGLPGYRDKYSLVSVAGIAGGGVRLRLSQRLLLGFEASGRVTPTDYLDDVSNTTVNYRELLQGNGSLAAMLSHPQRNPPAEAVDLSYRRGGPARDYVFSVGATVGFLFGGDVGGRAVRCPEL